MVKKLSIHASVFLLASLSFACLLGQFYGLWSMHVFGCWVLPPATILLAAIAWWFRADKTRLQSPWVWVVHGTIGGLLAAVAYDAYRVPFVLNGAPLFKVFPKFGELLVGKSDPRWLIQTVGWGYHFSNGAALGIMFLAMISLFAHPLMVWGGAAWALFVEAMLLLTPYASFFGLQPNAKFLFLTASAHLIFGLALGFYCRARFGTFAPRTGSG